MQSLRLDVHPLAECRLQGRQGDGLEIDHGTPVAGADEMRTGAGAHHVQPVGRLAAALFALDRDYESPCRHDRPPLPGGRALGRHDLGMPPP
jgi:hypothetical protein